VQEKAAEGIASIAWFIESKGMLATAEKFSDAVYDFIETMADTRKSYAVCREPSMAALGYKCISLEKNIQSFLLKQTTKLSFVSLFHLN
jgi:hypothetical protein